MLSTNPSENGTGATPKFQSNGNDAAEDLPVSLFCSRVLRQANPACDLEVCKTRETSGSPVAPDPRLLFAFYRWGIVTMVLDGSGGHDAPAAVGPL